MHYTKNILFATFIAKGAPIAFIFSMDTDHFYG